MFVDDLPTLRPPRALLASPSRAPSKSVPAEHTHTPMFTCVLTGDKMFSQTAPLEFVDDVAYSVRGSIDAGLDALLLESPMPPPGGSSLPIEVVDLVSWAGLRPTPLDRAGFMQRWQRYVAALQAHLQSQPDGERRAERLGKSGLLFARKLLGHFDELDFLVTASDVPGGGLAVLHYREDGLTPYLYFLAEGVSCDAPGESPPGRTASPLTGHRERV